MTLTVTDQLLQLSPSGTGKPVVGQVLATPSSLPFIMKIGSTWQDLQAPDQAAQTDSSGNWSIVLPWPSESNPNTVTWQLSLPDGTIWQGSVPEGVAGPLSIYQLKTTYGWAPVASAFSSSAVATVSTLGAVLVDVNPSSGNPIALTQAGIRSAIAASAAAGLLSLGPGPFDGTSAGHFAGSAQGTLLAGNTLAGFLGNLLDLQVNGSSKLSLDPQGVLNASVGGLATRVKAGAPTDADFTAPLNGLIVVDTTNSKVWFRVGTASWKGVAIA